MAPVGLVGPLPRAPAHGLGSSPCVYMAAALSTVLSSRLLVVGCLLPAALTFFTVGCDKPS